eukprot:7063014-Karenia_brevis.AAC.1
MFPPLSWEAFGSHVEPKSHQKARENACRILIDVAINFIDLLWILERLSFIEVVIDLEAMLELM